MKRLIISLISVLSLMFSSNVAAEEKEFTSEQLALRSEIMQFLKEEGYMPEIDADDDIKFKSEGRSYYVTVSKVDENPMYVTLFVQYSNPEDYSAECVVFASKALNMYKGVKLICFDDSYRISAELYLRDADLFKESFYKIKSQIDNVRGDFLDECKNASSGSGVTTITEIPFIITTMEVANVENDGTIIQDYGSTIYDFKTKYLQPRINIKPLKTSGTYTIYVKLYKDNVLQRNTSTSPDNFTYSTSITISGESQQIKTLLGWGSKNAGRWSQGSYRYEVWYNDYCIGSKTFKVI